MWHARSAAASTRATAWRAVRRSRSPCRCPRSCPRSGRRMDAERRLLIVEDDDAFARTLARSFERRGYVVLRAASLDEVKKLLEANRPGFAVVDLKLAGGASGLACVQHLHAHDPRMLIVVLTG